MATTAPEQSLELSVGEFVALLNQTLDYAYPDVVLVGELANLRVSKNRWVYFDLKDESASVKFFGTVYQLPGPLEDGMILKVRGNPRLHPLYGFSVNVQSIQPAGEGTIRRAAELLRAKLAAEGLFDEARKRSLPYPPARLGLITSRQSAAYADFIKILQARWQGITIELIDVQVQGEVAPSQIVRAIEHCNAQADPPEVLVLIRGGGSPEDLAAFSTEQVTRAIAGSRVPTMVAIGHEIDSSLAELAADRQASTPSNAAELLVPDRAQVLAWLKVAADSLFQNSQLVSARTRTRIEQLLEVLEHESRQALGTAGQRLAGQRQLLAVLSPQAILNRGYAIVRQDRRVIRSIKALRAGAIVDIQLADGHGSATIKARETK